jgi:methyltransferase (TIGR00027 family)
VKKKQSSLTARGIAAMRAVESSKPEGQRICYDPLARKLISPTFYYLTKLLAGYGASKSPGTIEFIISRVRYIDDYLQSCLHDGIEQLVILGAGLDSKAYRFEELKKGRKVFEVDHPATQQEKQKKVRKLFGELPGHVIYVPIDFNQESLDKLFEYGYEKQRKTLFIWEGVTYYLSGDAVDASLAFVTQNSSRGSLIV